jgi:hypothetical protein
MQFEGLASRAAECEKMGKLFDVANLDLSAVATTGKELELHGKKWALLADFREQTAAWMTGPVR